MRCRYDTAAGSGEILGSRQIRRNKLKESFSFVICLIQIKDDAAIPA
jgi:hypothetical protein